jgi:ABC-type antimicrobial peptide transport system permease subunit
MALGATARDIRVLILRDALATTSTGVLAGAALVLWTRPLAGAMLSDLKADSVAPLVVGTVAIFTIAALAAWLPVRRAVRVDPMAALRHE